MMGVAAISRDLGVGSVISVLQRPAMACAPSQSSRAGRCGLPSPLLSSFGMLANAPPEGDCPMPIEAEVEKRARELADVVHAACVTIQSSPAISATGSATARTSPAAPSTIARSSRTVLILGRLSRTAGSAFGLALAALLWLAGLSGGAAAQPRDVEVGAFVSSLSDINPSDGSFRVVLYVWFNDPAGRFNVERDLLPHRADRVDRRDRDGTGPGRRQLHLCAYRGGGSAGVRLPPLPVRPAAAHGTDGGVGDGRGSAVRPGP